MQAGSQTCGNHFLRRNMSVKRIILHRINWSTSKVWYKNKANVAHSSLLPSSVITDRPLKCASSDSVSEAALIALNKHTVKLQGNENKMKGPPNNSKNPTESGYLCCTFEQNGEALLSYISFLELPLSMISSPTTTFINVEMEYLIDLCCQTDTNY